VAAFGSAFSLSFVSEQTYCIANSRLRFWFLVSAGDAFAPRMRAPFRLRCDNLLSP
jgi:hypothetical protein